MYVGIFLAKMCLLFFQAPYIMYVEVLETDGHEPLPPRLLPPAPPAPHSPPIRHTKSEENLVPEWPTLSLYSPLDDSDAGDCWSHDDDELRAQYAAKQPAPDSLSQVLYKKKTYKHSLSS